MKSTGKLATVRPILVGIPGSENLVAMKSDAKGGIMIAYLITGNPGEAGTFTVGDWVHVWVNGEDYSELTKRQMGRTYEPELILDDVSQFNRVGGFDLIAPADKYSIVLRVKALGAAVLANSTIEVEIGAGWDKETENHKITFDPGCFVNTL